VAMRTVFQRAGWKLAGSLTEFGREWVTVPSARSVDVQMDRYALTAGNRRPGLPKIPRTVELRDQMVSGVLLARCVS
jgi:hypothetical protein